MRTRSSSPSMDDYERRVRETPARPAPPPRPPTLLPVGRPNPPPPPPPPPQQQSPAMPNDPQQQHDHPTLLLPLQLQHQHVVDNNRANEAWILNVRPPRSSASFSSSSSSSTVVRRIRVHPDMDVATLSACLQQALGVPADWDRISGLFQESTELFLPLQHILTLDDSDDKPQRQLVYTLELPELPTPTRRETAPWWEHAVVKYGFIPITAAWILYSWYSYRVHVQILHWIASTLHTTYHVILELPLQETYRHGPWFLGAWEGESLPRICARITYHGDQAFWERNLAECQRIFDAKLEAWLRLTRPVVGLAVVVVLVWAFRLTILAAWRVRAAAAEQQVRPVDREILDFYRAFQVVTRQIHRVTTTTTHVPEPPLPPMPPGRPHWRHRR